MKKVMYARSPRLRQLGVPRQGPSFCATEYFSLAMERRVLRLFCFFFSLVPVEFNAEQYRVQKSLYQDHLFN